MSNILFFFNDTATTEIYTLSLHDALPICLLDDPETLIPIHAVRELLEVAARTTGTQDFALRLAARRSLSHLGPISLVLQQEPRSEERRVGKECRSRWSPYH